MKRTIITAAVLAALLVSGLVMASAANTVKVGLNYPKTGPYSVQGLDQWRAAELAVEEINAAGGILGKPVEVLYVAMDQHPVDSTSWSVLQPTLVVKSVGGEPTRIVPAVRATLQNIDPSVPLYRVRIRRSGHGS